MHQKHIGCYISEKKKKTLDWPQFLKMALESGIEVHDLDLTRPIELPFKLDLVWTKFNAELISSEDLQSKEVLSNFQNYLEKNDKVIQLDPIDNQQKLTNRPEMIKLFQHITARMKDLFIPQSVVIKKTDQIPLNFPYPAICKTLEASGAMASHEMDIIWDDSQLQALKRPLLLQQLIDHNSTIFKIFVIGEFTHVVKRPSIRNLNEGGEGEGNENGKESKAKKHDKAVHFNSQQFKSLQGEPIAPLPDDQFIKSLTRIFSEDLGLTLVGIDIIRCSSTGKYYIIDANYFPGYGGVENCYVKFLDLIKLKLEL